MTKGGRTKYASGLARERRRFFLTGQARFGDDRHTASPAEETDDMSDLNATQRIIDACEGRPSGSPTRFDTPVDVAEVAVSRAVEVINHLLGPSPGLPASRTDFVGRDGYDLVIAPTLLASMLRAARGEPVTVGRLVFAGHTTWEAP